MPAYIEVPPGRLPADTLLALLEEYASREGTEYGLREFSLEEKVENLRGQLQAGELQIVFESESEEWDLLPTEQVHELLEGD